MLKHMAIKIRNCLILNRSRPTPEPEGCSFHVVFKSFIPELVRKCSQAPQSVMLPTRTFIGAAPTHAEAASKQQGETLLTKRGLFHYDNAASAKKELDKKTIDSHPPDGPGLGGHPKHDPWPNVDRDCIGEFDREPQNSGPSHSHETTSSRRPPNQSRNDNVEPGRSFRVAPYTSSGGPSDQQQPSPTHSNYYIQHGFGPPPPSTPGYANHDENSYDYAYGTQEMTDNGYFLEFDKSIVNSKEFTHTQMVPAKQSGETWSTWYLRFLLHGTLHGVYIPPWESMERDKIYSG
jgi:hypothetical protein